MIDALLDRAGITPPEPGKTHTQCPRCSTSRRKSRERCLMVKDQGWTARVYCHHCGWKKELS